MKDIARNIKKYDSELEYISGYENCNSIVKCKCNRCGNIFERRWVNIARHNTEYRCPICQTKLGIYKSKMNCSHFSSGYVEPIELREKKFIEKFKAKYPTLIYIGGYQHSDKSIQVKCNICNNVFNISAQCIRKGHSTSCLNCINKENKIKKTQNKINKYINKLKFKYDIMRKKEINKIASILKRNTQYIQKCNKCDKEYIEHTKSAYCPMCRKTIHHHHSGKSLKKLYERDKGICYICGDKCDWEDKRIVKGTTIVGNTYPSIDHIIPLAKGGTDEWNNLGLAHMRCNTIKGKEG